MKAVHLLSLLALSFARAEDFQGAYQRVEYEDAPIRYEAQTPENAISRLQARLASGETSLTYDKRFGYLPALLREMKVPEASQMLVFSKTSLQRSFISPQNPRALFFNDDVYIGYIPGAPAMEVSVADPHLGGVFYRLDNEEAERPHFVREEECLQCHGANRTLGIPGHFVRSIGTDSLGELDAPSEVSDIDQCTPMADRWAGYYVTGLHGPQTHRGNLVGPEAFARAQREPNFLGNLTDLRKSLPTEKYPRATSDIVALMVLEHQAKMHNYITRLNLETQIMMARYGHTRYLKTQTNAFLRYLLFTQEAPLSAPIEGDGEYQKEFTALGPRDSRGRSLRDFDLQTRLFRYPCSYLIYAPAFDALPAAIREPLLERLRAILTGEDQDPQFARLTEEERRAILEILRETKPNLPPAWRE